MPPSTHKPDQLQGEPHWNQPLRVPETKNVGELGAKWQFPSDHLPVGVDCLLGESRIRCASWNVLNSAHMHYIQANSQGLAGSLITELHVRGGSGLTLREEAVLREIVEMLTGGVDVLCLQECSTPFASALFYELDALKRRGLTFGVTPKIASLSRDEGLIVFNQNRLTMTEGGPKVSKYTGGNFIIETQFRIGLETLSVINTHVPGGPGGVVARVELADALCARTDLDTPFVVCGDMNAEPKTMREVFARQELASLELVPPAYFTHVNTQRQAAAFDMFFFSPGSNALSEARSLGNAAQLLASAAAAEALL